ncbi:MAG: hypothetical protein ACOWWH_13470 [Eubacteriaceae bacterium]
MPKDTGKPATLSFIPLQIIENTFTVISLLSLYFCCSFKSTNKRTNNGWKHYLGQILSILV